MVWLAPRPSNRQARDRHRLAPQGVQAFRDMEVAAGKARPTARVEEIRDLVREMSWENTLWGAPRIHGELLKLGFSISQAAVSKYMVHYPSPPSQAWRTFLTNHADCWASIDCFVVPTATFRLLFGFIVLHHERRQIVHSGVTENPTMAWVAQQIREAFRGKQHPDSCSAIEMSYTESSSGTAYCRWALKRLSRRHDHHGKTLMLNV